MARRLPRMLNISLSNITTYEIMGYMKYVRGFLIIMLGLLLKGYKNSAYLRSVTQTAPIMKPTT